MRIELNIIYDLPTVETVQQVPLKSLRAFRTLSCRFSLGVNGYHHNYLLFHHVCPVLFSIVFSITCHQAKAWVKRFVIDTQNILFINVRYVQTH